MVCGMNIDMSCIKVYTLLSELMRRRGMYDREPLYVISVAARLLDMHAQTLRKYEREQFIKPSRTQGRLRLYSAEDIERLRQIKYLVEERGLNLDGVNLALALTQRLDDLRQAVGETKSREEAVALVEAEMQKLLQVLGAPQAREQRQAAARDGRQGRQ